MTADARDLAETREFLVRWSEVIDAVDAQSRARLLNALLADAAAYPRITDHDGTGWHPHSRDDDVHLAAVMAR
ncbi:hypothetical protein NDR87_12540 [Nocardia sp. CDC159]|uniref:Uncharacterized protein n=1 Tax=Nocardia pulmonis TaxID=2951408 RepID=A0A9X2E5L2_9NOCA|nr:MULTISPECIES: hypothetical protein [Nocardia]MCM6774747.1 hypothetical protein [Nocardia pulmonis]MCM6787188.1 hypothetical protein [Nocardia sp. CDC159]